MPGEEPRPAGPVAEGASSAHPPESPPSAPPAGDAAQGSSAAAPAAEAPGQAAEASAAVEGDLDALLKEAEQKRDEYLELARRTQADFENYRKRMAAEVQAAATRGRGEVARQVIDAVDNLERALEAGGGDGDDLATGVRMVLDGLRETLARNGIEAVDPQGEKFDPQWHEALSTVPGADAPPGHVVQVAQKGYRLGEQLLRPARVVVSE